jgi:hypothetical protein
MSLSKHGLAHPRRLACIASIMSLAACSGGGSSGTPQAITTVQQVNGTITIVTPGTIPASVGRRPAFVSPATGHVALFINGAAAAAGSTVTCASANGNTGGCTISWTAALAVPHSYTFAVEADSGINSPANTVLSEGEETYTVVSGSNTVTALSLNGVVKDATFTATSCTTGSCSGTIALAAAAGNIISYGGALTVPAAGNNPSSGNVFDNGSVTFVSSAAGIGLVTGSAYTSGANVYASYATNTLTVSGVQASTTGTYPYVVTCGASATGTFGITTGGAGTPSGDVTTAELTALGVSYPAAAITVIGTAPSFSCASGTIGDATGTIPVN